MNLSSLVYFASVFFVLVLSHIYRSWKFSKITFPKQIDEWKAVSELTSNVRKISLRNIPDDLSVLFHFMFLFIILHFYVPKITVAFPVAFFLGSIICMLSYYDDFKLHKYLIESGKAHSAKAEEVIQVGRMGWNITLAYSNNKEMLKKKVRVPYYYCPIDVGDFVTLLIDEKDPSKVIIYETSYFKARAA